MRTHDSPAATALLGLVLASLSGCSTPGAPDISVGGAYFPAWLLCALVGVIGAVLARVIFVATNLTDLVPYQLTSCTGIGVIVATLTWLLFFR